MSDKTNKDRAQPPQTALDWLNLQSPPAWAKARWVGALFGVIIVLLFTLALVALVGVLFHTTVNAFSGKAEGPNLGAGALIAALLGSPFVIWGTWLKYQTVRYQKEGHITDRINKAVEMLGAEKTVKKLKKDKSGSVEVTAPNIEVRIGAILSLERIAQDSTEHDKGRDHVRVMEILCAYVRENSNARKLVDFPEEDWEPLEDDADEATRAAHLEKRKERFGKTYRKSKAWIWAQTLSPPRADIAQSLTVLGRRTFAQRRVEAEWPNPPSGGSIWPYDMDCPSLPQKLDSAALTESELQAFKKELAAWQRTLTDYAGYRLDLRGINLRCADLSGANLSGAKLNGARMEGANLRQVRMKGADLQQTRMEGANLWEARMEGANLSLARMESANLRQARMEAADLWAAWMEGANLSEAQMKGSDLWNARMEGADLRRARMEGADLWQARMEGANLWEARMERADLRATQMAGANLQQAQMASSINLTDAMLRGASLRSVDFTDAALSQDQIDQMFGDGSVKLPIGLTRPAHWPEEELGGGIFNSEWRKWQADPEGYRPPAAEAAGD